MHIEKVFPNWIWLVYGVLFSFSIPWYLPQSLAMQLFLGLPLWLLSCILAIIMMAVFTVFIIYKYWKN